MPRNSEQAGAAADAVSVFSQQRYRCRFDWGRHGTHQAAARGDILVIVDTLSFSTATVTAIHHGAWIYPCAPGTMSDADAARLGAELAVGRRDVPEKGRFSLSPLTFSAAEPGTRVVLPSPNGATCSRYADAVPYLFAGALVNATAVGRAVTRLLAATGEGVTVIACGERWPVPTEDGALRFAVEDYLGAGAILAAITAEKSPEAQVCESAFRQAQATLPALLWDCGSGRELRAMGYPGDVAHAGQHDLYDSVPCLRNGFFQPLS